MRSIEGTLSRDFGFDEFLPGQYEAIKSALDKRDTIVVMPTGSGKSLCYQLPALLLDGTTLVVSPLIALMKDQVDMLCSRGIAATFINSSLNSQEKSHRRNELRRGKYKLLHVSPERLRSRTFLSALKDVKIPLLAVDEAHCISQWGHDFRPDYLHIKDLLFKLKRPTIIALTATATRKVKNDILKQLDMNQTREVITGFDRPNLELKVRYVTDDKKKLEILDNFFKTEYHPGDSGIIYVGTRQKAEFITDFLVNVLNISACFYHAGLEDNLRKENQERFLKSEIPVIVATNAFGMGIDKPDVRFVIHYQITDCLERYYQEIGRAGRDGKQSKVLLLYCPEDRALQEWFIENSTPTEQELRQVYKILLQKREEDWVSVTERELEEETGIFPSKLRLGIDQLAANGIIELGDNTADIMNLKPKLGDSERINLSDIRKLNDQRKILKYNELNKMLVYGETDRCRRSILLNHFGDKKVMSDYRYCCDNCEPDFFTGTEDFDEESYFTTIKILECVDRFTEKLGRFKLAKVLTGSKARDIVKWGYNKSPSYNTLSTYTQKDTLAMIDALIDRQLIKIVGGDFPLLKLTGPGMKLLKEPVPTGLKKPAPKEVLKSDENVSKTIIKTYGLFKEGLTPEEISSNREISIRTIYNHIAKLIELGKIEVNAVVSPTIQRQVEAAISKVGFERLTPIKELLPEDITFEQIRCVAAHYKRAEMLHKPASDSKVKQYIYDFFKDLSQQKKTKFVWLIGELRAEDGVSMLIEALKDDSANVRHIAATALGKIGAGEAASALIEALDDPDGKVRQRAGKALRKIGDPLVLQKLKEVGVSREDVDKVRVSVDDSTGLISKIGTRSPKESTKKRIENYLKSEHPQSLEGNWDAGFALDFHSHFEGTENKKTTLGQMITDFKYHGKKSLAGSLAQKLVDFIEKNNQFENIDFIVGVPSTQTRDYQPVHLLALNVAKRLSIPYKTGILVKTRKTKQQKEMKNLEQKTANVKGAFGLERSELIRNKTVLLIDDLVNTGETLKEATRILKRGKPSKLLVLAVTKTQAGVR
ncbi:RecQ family ATP-dependent DNA helicase [bacterium]|nr:RecQ family ATP-dependent DNA helicase [bacterium]